MSDHLAPTALPTRVQRIIESDLPVLQLEPAIPAGIEWPIVVDGLVEDAVRVSLGQIREMGAITRTIDLHCVWGWSRPGLVWEGVHLNALARLAKPLPGADHVLIGAFDSPYAACFTLEEAKDGIFALRMDGRDLSPEHGGPVRFVGPSYKWAYKHVKWAARVTFLHGFSPGMWEERVGDPRGDIPWSVLQQFDGQAQAWRARRTRTY